MADTRSYKRRQFLVHTGLQLRYVFWLVLAVGILSLALGFVLYSTVTSSTGLVLSVSPNRELLEHKLTAMDRRTMSLVAALLVFNLAFVAALGVFLSHRIAGPLHKLKQHMNRVAQGDYSVRITFRKSDVLPDVAKSFNEMTEAIERRDRERAESQGRTPSSPSSTA